MTIFRIFYHVSDCFLVLSTFFMILTVILWLAYFSSQIYSNYNLYKNLQLRFNDVDNAERMHSIKKTLQRDFLFVIVLISELLTPTITIFEVLVPFIRTNIDGLTINSTRIEYNCTRLVEGSYVSLLTNFGSVECIIQALGLGALIIHIRLYKQVLEFFIKEYRRVSFGKTFYFSILVTLVQFLLVVVLSSLIRTFVFGITLSVLFLIFNTYSVAKSGKVLYLNLKCYLQELRLIHTFDAISEYNRVLKMTRKYRVSMIIFIALLIVLSVGFLVYTIGCIWVEWLFLVECERLNPYVFKVNISDVAKQILLDISLFSRTCQSIGGVVYSMGIVVVSIAMGWNILYTCRRTRSILNAELRKPLM